MKAIEMTREGKMHWAEYTKNACAKVENSISDAMPAFFPVAGKRDFFGILGACGITPTGEVMPAANAANALEKLIAKTKVKYPGTSVLPFLVWMSIGGRDSQSKAEMFVVLNKSMVESYMPTLINRLAIEENKADYLETLELIAATSSAQEDDDHAAFERDNTFPWARGLQTDSVWRNRTIGLISDLLHDCAITVKSDESDEGRAIENTFLFLMYLAATVGMNSQYLVYTLTHLGLHRYLPNLMAKRIIESMEEQMVIVDGKMNPIIYQYIANTIYDNNMIIKSLLSMGQDKSSHSQALYHLNVTDKMIDSRMQAVCDGQSILSVFGFDGPIKEDVPKTVYRLEEFYVRDSLTQCIVKMENQLSLEKLDKTSRVKQILTPFNEAVMSSALRVQYTKSIKGVLLSILECADAFNNAQSQIKSLVELLSIESIIEMTQKLADTDKKVNVLLDELDLLVKEALLANEEANDPELQQTPVVHKTESELVSMYEDEIHTLTGKVQDLTAQLADSQQKLQKAGQLISEQPNQVAPVVKCDHNMLQRALSDDLRVEEIPNIVKAYFDHVVFLPGSTDELKNSMYKKPAKVLEALIRLCGPYYETLMSGKPDSVAMEVLGNLYRANESGLTMGTPDLRRLREFDVKGKRMEFEQHLDIGTRHGDAYCMQVHFRIIEGILYIGRMGGHLPVSKLR